MQTPERYSALPSYAFPRLRALLSGHAPGGPEVNMTIGEPRHAMPPFLDDVLSTHTAGFARYPVNEGTPELLEAISNWIMQRYGVRLPAEQIMALNGTREGLFAACMALCPEPASNTKPVVLTPNPFYQVYAVAAVSVGAKPVYVNATRDTNFLPDYAALPKDLLDQVQIAYICSPANPQGAVADKAYWRDLLTLAERHDFRVFADECYSEIWRDTPPTGALEIAAEMGADPERVTVFHSLSKRSNLPGLRSGFVAGGPDSIRRIRQLRAYAGAPLPLPLQAVAAATWADEAHVDSSRALYQEKYRIADDILGDIPGYYAPQAGFFLWLPVPDGEAATISLYRETGIKVLPGAYLSRDTETGNPGAGFIRVALVTEPEETRTALKTLRAHLYE
jgi:N-succinyldiaminopimelate aminotransferase